MIAENGLWFCDKCKSLLVEHESWFVEIASEHLCVCCAENEIVGLRDQLRWRKWPEEKPTETGYYIVWKFNLSYTPNGFYSVNSDSWDVMWKRFYWMPQMPLPEVES